MFTSGTLINEKRETVYRFRSNFDTLPGSWLYVHGREVGYVRCEFGSVSKYGIYLNSEKIDRLIKERLFFRQNWYLEKRGWKLQGDVEECRYQILDHNEKLIADVGRQRWGIGDYSYIEITDEKNELLVCLIVMAVDNMRKASVLKTKK